MAVFGDQFAFTWPDDDKGANVKVTPRRHKVSELINSLPTPNDRDIFLFCYVGHARPATGGDLYFAFEDNKVKKPTANHTLSSVLSEIKGHGFKEIIVVLDCCHAGSAINIFENLGVRGYLAISSVDAWAKTDFDGGVFTKRLLDSLSFDQYEALDERVDKALGALTLERVLRFAVATTIAESDRSIFFSLPELKDLGLGKLPLQQVRTRLPRSLRLSTPVNSVYRKIYAILNALNEHSGSVEKFIEHLRTLREFRFRRVNDEWTYVSEDRIDSLLRFCAELRILQYGKTIKYTNDGIRGANKAFYTEVLRDAILSNIIPPEISIEDIRQILVDAMQENERPDISRVLRVLYLDRNIIIEENEYFIEGMKLLPFVGVFEKASAETLFPGIPYEING
ncbi:MAG: hypothetical protein AAFR71_10570 [Pseudomonadota bacterium]